MNENNEKETKSKTIKRALALLGVIILLGLYVATFVAAFSSSPGANALFVLSLAATAFVPISIYILRWFFGRK